MNYVRGSLRVLGAVFATEFVLTLWWMFRDLGSEKATGISVLAASFVESLFTPQFWIVAILLFAGFFAASKLRNTVLRVLLFWTPTVLLLTVGVSVAGLAGYMCMHFRAQ